MNNTRSACILFAFFLLGCNSNPIEKKQNTYFSVDSLVQHQVQLLALNKVQLIKHTSINDTTETQQLVLDSIAWQKEFALLQNCDINQPKNRGLYTTSLQNDSLSNLKIKVYRATQADLPVQEIALYYYEELIKLKKLKIRYFEQNTIFEAQRSFDLDFDQIEEQNFLTGYSIDGFQKMIFKDSLKYSVSAKVLPKE